MATRALSGSLLVKRALCAIAIFLLPFGENAHLSLQCRGVNDMSGGVWRCRATVSPACSGQAHVMPASTTYTTIVFSLRHHQAGYGVLFPVSVCFLFSEIAKRCLEPQSTAATACVTPHVHRLAAAVAHSQPLALGFRMQSSSRETSCPTPSVTLTPPQPPAERVNLCFRENR